MVGNVCFYLLVIEPSSAKPLIIHHHLEIIDVNMSWIENPTVDNYII